MKHLILEVILETHSSLSRLPKDSRFLKIPLTIIFSLYNISEEKKGHSYNNYLAEFEKHVNNGQELSNIIVDNFKKIFSENRHIAICCNDDISSFATIMDIELMSRIYSYESIFERPITENEIKMLVNRFIELLHSSKYQRYAIFHLYNLELDNIDKLQFDDCEILYISGEKIAKILGENTVTSILHSSNTGNYFLVFKDSSSPMDSNTWLDEKKAKANEILDILQLFKEGIINIDYYTFYFEPDWVNTLWRYGSFFIGQINKNETDSKYVINQSEKEELFKYFNVYKENLDKFNNLKNSKLGHTILRATKYFSNYHIVSSKEEKFLNLFIAFESLFSKSGPEYGYRMNQCASNFIADNDELGCFDFLKKLLSKRSALFHGNININNLINDDFLDDEDLKKFAKYIRISILKYIILYLKGEDDKKNILSELEKSAFNDDIKNALKEKADIDDFIK